MSCHTVLLPLTEPQQSAMETHSVTGSAGLCNALLPKVQINPAEAHVSGGAGKSVLGGEALA